MSGRRDPAVMELGQIEAVDFFLYRWLIYIVTFAIFSVYVHVNLNQPCALALMALQCLHGVLLLGFNVAELVRRSEPAILVRLRLVQLVLYRMIVGAEIGLLIWLTISMIINTARAA